MVFVKWCLRHLLTGMEALNVECCCLGWRRKRDAISHSEKSGRHGRRMISRCVQRGRRDFLAGALSSSHLVSLRTQPMISVFKDSTGPRIAKLIQKYTMMSRMKKEKKINLISPLILYNRCLFVNSVCWYSDTAREETLGLYLFNLGNV